MLMKFPFRWEHREKYHFIFEVHVYTNAEYSSVAMWGIYVILKVEYYNFDKKFCIYFP